jgi:hypothetical protein
LVFVAISESIEKVWHHVGEESALHLRHLHGRDPGNEVRRRWVASS